MATSVGTLQANLTLNASNFTRGMGKAVIAAQRLGSTLSTALGRKSQSFSTIGNSADAAASSMKALSSSISEVTNKAQEVSSSFSSMTANIGTMNPFANMEGSLTQILAEITTMREAILGLNAELTNTNTQIEKMKSVMKGNSNFNEAKSSAQKLSNSVGTANQQTKELGKNMQAVTKGADSAAKSTDNIKQKLGEASFKAKDIKRILEGIVVSQVFYRLLSIMSELVNGSIQFMQNMEQTELSFKYLLGDAQAAAAMVEKLQDFAIASPLDTSGAADATRYLLNMGFAAQNVVDVLSVITDAAVVSGANVNDAVHSISVALGQMLQSGTASAQEIRQLYNAGIPVVKILNEQLGLTGKEVKNIGELAIDSETVVAALLQGMKEQFAGASQEMQETFKGAMSAIMDSIFVFANVAAEHLYGTFRDKIVELSNAMQYLVTVVRKLGPGGVFEILVPDKNWQTIIRNVIGAFQQLGMAIQYWYKILGSIFKAMGQEILQILSIILPPITIMANFIMKFAYGLLQAVPAIKYFFAALALLVIAKPIISLMIMLWKTIGLGSICLKVAGYIKLMAKALATLTIAHPVIAAIAAITAIILTLTGVTQKAINKLKELLSLLGGKLAKFGGKDKTIDPGLNIGYDPSKILQPIEREDQKQAEDYQETMEDLADSLEDVGDNAKKAGKSLKNNFNQSFDEVFDILPKKSAAKDLLGFDPEEFDITPLEDFFTDLGSLTPEFDFGGTVDNFMDAWRTMIKNMIKFAKAHAGELAIALTGALAGLALGNPWVALAYALVALFWDDLCEAFGIDVPNQAGIAAAIGSGLGTAIGYLLGGRIGAYIGGAVGLLASTVFSIVLDRIAEKFKLGDYSKAASAIGQSIGTGLGAALGGIMGGPIGAAIGAAIGDFAGGLVGLIWGGLVEKLEAQPSEGVAAIATAIEGFIEGSVISALSSVTGNSIAASLAGDVGTSLATSVGTGIATGFITGAVSLLSTALINWIGIELGKTAEDLTNAGYGGIAGSIVGAIIGIIITACTGGAGAFIIPLSTALGNTIGQAIGLFATDIGSYYDAGFQLISDYFNEKFSWLNETFANFDWANPLDSLQDMDLSTLAGNLGTSIGELLGDVVNAIVTFFGTTLPKTITSGAKSFKTWLTADIPNWFGNLGTNIGNALGDGVTAITDFFTVIIPDFISNIDVSEIMHTLGEKLGYAIGTAIKTLIDVKDSIGEFFTNLGTTFIDEIKGINWSEIGQNIKDELVAALDVIKSLPSSAIDTIGSFFTNLWTAFTDKISDISWKDIGTDILDGIMWIFTDGISELLTKISDGVSNFFGGFVDGIKEAFGIHSPAAEMKPFGEFIIEGILEGINNVISTIETWVNNNIYTPMKNAIDKYFNVRKWLDQGKTVILGIKDGIVNKLTDITTWIKTNIFDKFKNGLDTWFTSSSPDILNTGKNMIQGILEGIKSGLVNIKSWLKDNVYDKIVGGIKDLFGIASPAKEMMPLGEFVSQGFGIGITDAMTYVIKDINKSMQDVMQAFEINDNPLVAWSDDVWSSINTKITMAIDKVRELMDLANQSISIQAGLSGLNYSRDRFNYNTIPQDTEGAENFADALVSRLGPILAQDRNDVSNGASIEALRPLYVGTLIADERGLRELERKMRVITDAENERRGR